MFPWEQVKYIKKVLTPWYVTGFCEGEAAFTYSKSGKGLALYFAIKSSAEDSDLIAQIREFFGVGEIYRVKSRLPGAYSGFTKQAVYYRVTKISHLERIVQHFDKYPLTGKKYTVYQVWKKMVLVKKNFRKPEVVKLQELASSLSELSSKNTALKRKLENNKQWAE